MNGIWINKFEVVLRPLRDRAGAQTTIVIETRTAAQATREATARHPDMKVVSVTRVTPTVASLKAAQRAEANATNEAHTTEAANDGAPVMPLRRVGNH